MLLDSNIIIYSAQPEYGEVRHFIAEYDTFISALSYVEVLGYHRLSEEERTYFQAFFQIARILPISEAILEQAIILRQQRRMTLADAIIAGTVLVHELTLVTRNTADFQWILNLSLFNLFED